MCIRRLFSLALTGLLLGLLLVAKSAPLKSPVVSAASPPQSLAQVGDPFLKQISDEPDKRFTSPNISGDGQWVTYAHQSGSGYVVYVAPSDGSAVPKTISEYAKSYDISADGTVAYVERDLDATTPPYYRVYLYKNGTTRDLTPCVQHAAAGEKCLQPFEVAISGNGKWLFITSPYGWPCHAENYGTPENPDWGWKCEPNPDLDTCQVFRVATSTGVTERISSVQATDHHQGASELATDFQGSKVAFSCEYCDGGEFYLYSVNSDGSGPTRLASIYDSWHGVRISDDGNWIIFPGDQDGELGLDIIRPDGSDHRKLVSNDSSAPIPLRYDISYDGSLIAFTGLKDSAPCFQKFNTFLINNDGTGLRCVLESTTHDSSPTIIDPAMSHDALTMVFLSDDDLLGTGVQWNKHQVFTYRQAVAKFVSPTSAQIGSRLYYTLTLRHGEQSSLSASLTDPMPENTIYVPSSVWASKGTPSYDDTDERVTWSGSIAPEETVTVTFAVTATCSPAPPPPTMVENQATAAVGGETYQPMAITAVELPEKNLTALADTPANGAQGVLIESDGQGPLLQWHDQAAGLTCGTDPDTADVAYQVYLRKQGGSWQEVGGYPNCSRQIQLSEDALLCQEDGDPAAYQWKVVSHDPKFPCREPVENTFGFATASCRPEVDVKPEFTLAPGYFLDNQGVENLVRVDVDWNGPAYATPDTTSPYGDVYFNLNDVQIKKSGQQWGAQHAYDMGGDFDADFSCANNTLQIWAAGDDFESLKTTLQPTVFPFPGWVNWLDDIDPSLGEFSTEEKSPLVEYTYDFKYPEPAFEATWEPDDWVPYLGGEEVGIEPTYAEANAAGQSDGAGTAGVSGQTGLALAAFTSEGNLWGQGEAQFVCGESLDLERAVMGFSIHTTVEKEAGLADVIPAVKAAEGWPVVGRIIRWVNQRATVKGSFTPGVEIETEFEEKNDELAFVAGEGTGSIDARAELATEVCEDLTASVYGGGTPYVTVQVPAQGDPETYLKEMGIDLYYGATFQAWEFEEEYEQKVNCNYPGGCEEVGSQGLMAMAHDEPDWHLISRREPAPMMRATGALLQATSNSTETALVSPVYARPEPALAVADDGMRLLAYVDDDVSDPDGRHTEIRARIWDGSWSGTDDVTNDQQPDFGPAVAFDGSGNGVAIWERSTLPAGVTPSLNITFAQSLEIAASTWNGNSWSAPVTLTNDSLMDFAPRLSSGSDGSVMALWQTNDGTDILGTAAHPLTYTYALWDGTGWLTPTAALTGLHDVVGTAFAAYSSTQAALVYAMDADGEMTTTADADLYYSTFDGNDWSAPDVLVSDTIPITDTTPALAYDADGSRHLLWLRGGDLVWLEDSWDIGDVQTVRSASTEGGFLGFELSRDPNGNLSLIWQAMGADGADLAYSVYDAAHDAWGADQTLMGDADVETAHSPAFGDGSLYLAYQKVTTEFVTKTLSGASGAFTVTNVPTPGLSSLAFLEHTVGRDLTFDSLTVTPTNPAAGQQVTLTAVLRNAGDLTVSSPQVAFYDGASQINSTQTLPDLSAGTTTTVEVDWTVPSAAAHTLNAVADPNAQVTETDETNNAITTTTTLPDLQVDVLYTRYSSQAITVTARLTNAGVLTTGTPFTVAFRAADPVTGTSVATATVTSPIAAGDQFTVTQALTDPASLAGLGNMLWAVADDGDVVAEADETNNTSYAALGTLPDLTLAAEDIQGSGPLAIAVHNAGVITATGAALTVHQGALTGTLLYSSTLDTLGPGDSQTVGLSSLGGQIGLWAKADPDDAIAESNEGNNLAIRAVEVSRHIYLPLVMRSAE